MNQKRRLTGIMHLQPTVVKPVYAFVMNQHQPFIISYYSGAKDRKDVITVKTQ